MADLGVAVDKLLKMHEYIRQLEVLKPGPMSNTKPIIKRVMLWSV